MTTDYVLVADYYLTKLKAAERRAEKAEAELRATESWRTGMKVDAADQAERIAQLEGALLHNRTVIDRLAHDPAMVNARWLKDTLAAIDLVLEIHAATERVETAERGVLTSSWTTPPPRSLWRRNDEGTDKRV